MLQVTTVTQAIQAAERRVDVIVAQGGEAGGYAGDVSTVALVPQGVDAVSPIPVVAAGGIFEAPVSTEWKQAIAGAKSEDAIKVDVLNDISPLPGTAGYRTVLRSLHTPFLDEWSGKREAACRDRDRLRGQMLSTHQAGRQHETLLTAGQTVGGIKEILPVAEICAD
jgi:enoyl-[acyl-carrier protein] reductase II